MILARLAYGTWLAPGSVPRRPPSLEGRGRRGITGVTTEEIRAAATLGLTLRLLVVAERPVTPGDEPRVRVVPTAVPLDGHFGLTTGVLNRIEVDAEPLGRFAVDGPGAGGAATSSAVLGDLIAIGRGDGSSWAGLPPATSAASSLGSGAGRARRRHRRGRLVRVPSRRPGPPGPVGIGRPVRGRSSRWHGAPDGGSVARPGAELDPGAARPAGRLERSGRRAPLPDRRLTVLGQAADRARLVERYRRFLPITDATPALTLGEGGTPLLRARRLGKEIGLANLYLKVEGQNPTGSFKDRGMVVAVARALEAGATAIICASTGNTSASAAAYAAAAGIEAVVVLPRGQIAPGKLLQALVAGARVVADRRQLRPGAGDRPRAGRRSPTSDDPRQLGQPVPHRGPEDGRVRSLRRPRPGAGRPGDPGRERRQHHGLLGRLRRLPRGRPHRSPCRACSASRRPAPRRSCWATRRAPGDRGDGHPDRQSRVVGRGGRRPATSREGRSRPSPTTRSWPPTATSRGSRACSASRRRRRRWRASGAWSRKGDRAAR